MIVPLFLACALVAPGTQRPLKGPASDEIAALVKADQAVRKFKTPPPKEAWDKIRIGDLARESRIRGLLQEELVATKEDFAGAALILQHGEEPEDFELARELAIIACFKGGVHSLPALAEDRFLSTIGRKQRFGSQFDWEGNLKELAEAGPATVTENLRLDYLVPPLAAARAHGMSALERVQGQMFARIERRWLDKKWHAEARAWPETAELARLSMRAKGDYDYRAAERVLDIYRRDRIGPPEAYANAAKVLLTSSEEQYLLLSGELAALAAMRGHAPAKSIFARAWDKYLTVIGRRDRYGTLSGAARASRAVMRELGLVPVIPRKLTYQGRRYRYGKDQAPWWAKSAAQ
jgi:hypothetical protein